MYGLSVGFCMASHETIGNSSDGIAGAWVGSVDRVAQGCNIRSPVALAWRVGADYPLSVSIAWSFDANGVLGGSNSPDSCTLAVAGRPVAARRHRAARAGCHNKCDRALAGSVGQRTK